MAEKYDDILKQALAPNEEPDLRLNRKIINQVKETDGMMKKRKKWAPGIVFAIALTLVLGSAGVYAAYRFLTPQEAAEHTGDKKLAAAFESEDAVKINETQHFRDYDVTLLGIVSGEEIADHLTEKNGEVQADRTYAVTAVGRADGSSMPEQLSDPEYDSERFFISPLIEGCNPLFVNIGSMDGAYVEFTQDGILYRLTECDNLEMFADRTVYLCVLSGDFYDEAAYSYDEASGAITRTESYEGVNALFTLPLDSKQADREAAEQYIADLMPDEDSDQDSVQEQSEVDAFMAKITPENIDQYAERVESTVWTIPADEDGVIYHYMIDGEELGGVYMERARMFPDGKTGMSDRLAYFDYEKGMESLKIATFTLNEDGSVTCAIYVPIS